MDNMKTVMEILVKIITNFIEAYRKLPKDKQRLVIEFAWETLQEKEK